MINAYNTVIILSSSVRYSNGGSDCPTSVDCKAQSQDPICKEKESPSKNTAKNGGGCLIATAAFDSELSVQVQQLRELRDNSLMRTELGNAFMTGFNSLYYSFSPVIADYERENPTFKNMVKLTITPMLASLSLLNYVDVNTEVDMLGYGIGIIMVNAGMYFIMPAVVIWQIRKMIKI